MLAVRIKTSKPFQLLPISRRTFAFRLTNFMLMEREERKQIKQREKEAKMAKRAARSQGDQASQLTAAGTPKLKGAPWDNPDVRISKTVSWILRHGCQSEGIPMRLDGYVRVCDLLNSPKMRGVDFPTLEGLVKKDAKTRYHLLFEPKPGSESVADDWWIRANQGHSIKAVVLDLDPITKPEDIPTGIAVHGTTLRAWDIIKNQGLHKMNRNHIHLAQGVAGSGIISGMRKSSQVLIYIDLPKALAAGIPFFLSANGVVLSPGNEQDGGYLKPGFFQRVELANGQPVPGWEGSGPVQPRIFVQGDQKTSVEESLPIPDPIVELPTSSTTPLLSTTDTSTSND